MNSVTFNVADLKKVISTFYTLKCSSGVLPILEYMKVVCFAHDQRATIRATDLVMDVKHELSCEVESDFRFVVPFKKVYQALKYIQSEDVAFRVDEHDVTIISEEIKVKIRIHWPLENFPKVVVPDDSNKGYIIASDYFISMFRTTARFASDDGLRPSMTGVNLTSCAFAYDGGEMKLYFVATNAHMLLYKKTQHAYCGYDMLIPKEASTVISSVFKDIQPLLIFKRNNLAVIHGANCKMSIRLIDENYPDWESVMPKDDAFSLYVKRKQLEPVMRLCETFSNLITKQVLLTIGKDKMKIETEDNDWQNSVSSNIPVYNSNQEEDTYKVVFNPKFFLKAISTKPDELIRITHSQNSNKPSIINGEVLIMPIQLANYDL